MEHLPISDPKFTPPRDVERIWAGKDRHYATGTPVPYDRTRALKQMEQDGGAHSESVLSRAVTAYGPRGREIPGLIPKWPILKHQERPWVLAQANDSVREAAQTLRDARAEYRVSRAVVDTLLDRAHAIENVVADEEDSQQLLRLTRLLTLMREVMTNASGMAAMFGGAYLLLDVMSDGKLNSVIVWCHVLSMGHVIRV